MRGLQDRAREWYLKRFYLLRRNESDEDGDVGPENFCGSLQLLKGFPRQFINDMEAFFIGSLDPIQATTNNRREEEGNMCAVKATSGACLLSTPALRSLTRPALRS